MSRLRKRNATLHPAAHQRHHKAFLLPMDLVEVNRRVLRFRLALERMRSGHGDFESAIVLTQVTFLTRFITEAGHGRLDETFFAAMEARLIETIKCDGNGIDAWQFPTELVDLLTKVVNEHDRQLRETRLGVIAEATKRLERILAGATRMSDLFPCRAGMRE
jgi:hypothetical protein